MARGAPLYEIAAAATVSTVLFAVAWTIALASERFVGVGEQIDDWRHNPVVCGVKVSSIVDAVLPSALETRSWGGGAARSGRGHRRGNRSVHISGALRQRRSSPAKANARTMVSLESGRAPRGDSGLRPNTVERHRRCRHTLSLFLIGQLFFNVSLTAYVICTTSPAALAAALTVVSVDDLDAQRSTVQLAARGLAGAGHLVAMSRAADSADVARARDTEILRALCRAGISVPPPRKLGESKVMTKLVWASFIAADLDGSADIDVQELRGGIAVLVRAANASSVWSGLSARNEARARSAFGAMGDFDEDDTNALDVEEYRAFISQRWRALFEYQASGGSSRGGTPDPLAENFRNASATCAGNATAARETRRRCVCERLSPSSLRHVVVNVLGHAETRGLFLGEDSADDPDAAAAEATEWCLTSLGAISPLDPSPALAAARARAESVREARQPNALCMDGTLDALLVSIAQQRLIDPLIAFLETAGSAVAWSGATGEDGADGIEGDARDAESAALLFERFQRLRNTAIAEATRVTRCGASKGATTRHVAKLRARYMLTGAQGRCAVRALALSLWADLWIADTKRKAEERLADVCKHWSSAEEAETRAGGGVSLAQLEDVTRHFEQYARVVHELPTPLPLRAWIEEESVTFAAVVREFEAWEHSGMAAQRLQALDERELFEALANATSIANSGCAKAGSSRVASAAVV